MVPSLVRRLSRRLVSRPACRPPSRLALVRLEDRRTPAAIAWDGGVGGNGTDFMLPINWAGDVLPGPNDDATVGATGNNPAIVLRDNVTLRSLTNLREIDITGNGTVGPVTLTLSNGGSNSGFLVLTSTEGTYDATLAVSGGTLANAGPGVIRADVGATGLRSVTLTGGGNLSNAGLVLANTADLAVTAGGAGSAVTSTGSLNTSAGRTLTVSGGAGHSFGGIFGGTVRLTGLTAAIPAAGLPIGSSNTLVVDNSTIDGPGTLTLQTGATLRGETASTVNAPVVSSGTVEVVGTLSLLGTTTAGATAHLKVRGNGAFGPASATVADYTNAGFIELFASDGDYDATLTVSGGTLTNQASGVITPLQGTGGARAITLAAAGRLNNAGYVSAFFGDLTVTASGAGSSVTNTGQLAAAGMRTLTFSGGTANSLGGLLATASGGTVRLADLTATIPAGGLTVQFDNTLVVDNATIDGPGTLSLALGATLVGETASTVNAPVTNDGTILVRGSLALLGPTTSSGGLAVEGNGTLGPASATVANFTNGGEIRLRSVDGTYDATLTVAGGTLANQFGKSIFGLAGTGGVRTVTLGANGLLNNGGIVVAFDADLAVNVSGAGATVTNTGNFAAAAGRTLTVTGGTANSLGGTVQTEGTGIVRLRNLTAAVPAGGLSVFGVGATLGTFALDNAVLNGSGTVSIPAAGTLAGENPSTVNAPVTNRGTILVRGGLTLAGPTTNAAGSVLRVQGNGTFGPATATVANFTNAGLIELTSADGIYDATLNVPGGTLVNQAGGTLTALAGLGGMRAVNLTAGAQFANQGTTSAATADLTVNLAAGGAATNTGTYTVAAGRTLSLAGGTFTNFSGTTLTGGTYGVAGTFQFDNAAVNTLAANLILTGPGSAVLNRVTTANALAGLNAIAAAGRLELAGNRNLTAPAFNSAGTLLVNAGSTFTAPALTNAAGGTLAGNGTAAGPVSGGGTISPGTSPGTLTVSGDLNLAGPLTVEITGAAPGSGYDQLVVNGTVTLNGATLNASRTFASQAGNQFVLLANDGTDPVAGTFAGLPQGATLAVGDRTFTITYAGGTGNNDIVLTQLPAAKIPQAGGVVVNAGQANTTQRSRVTSITVAFTQVVVFANPNDVAAAFGLSRIGGGAVGGFTATANVVGGVTVVTLSAFTGAETRFGSLADGRYTLLVRASQLVDFDGNGDGVGGDDYTLAGTVANKLFCFFGDVNADGTVNAADFGPFFRPAFGTSTGDPLYLAFLDYNNDGTINASDFGMFARRFGATVP